MEDLVRSGISRSSDSLILNPELRDKRWRKIEIEGQGLYYTKSDTYFVFCHANPRRILPSKTPRHSLYFTKAADPAKTQSQHNVDECITCVTIRSNGNKAGPECVHLRAARKLANYI